MKPYRVHGMTQSHFTCKMTGYMAYKGIPFLFRRFGGTSPASAAAGFPGGVPAVQTPDGEFMWDSTSMIHHLELRFPQPSVFPDDPAQRFLCYLIEDAADEWTYRMSVGTRWNYLENNAVGGYELGRDLARLMPVTGDMAYAAVGAHVRSTCPPLGVTPENVGSWVESVLRPWMRVLGAHLNETPYLFGARPSLADFGLFGGNAAHYINDPLCRRWLDEDAPTVVRQTYNLLEPEDETFGDWDTGEPRPTLIRVLAELGRFYLPWVSRACRDGEAEVTFDDGAKVTIRSTEFLRDARAVLLARYVALRSDRLDAILERAGILRYFADYVAQAGSIPDCSKPPRPALNRPFPPEE